MLQAASASLIEGRLRRRSRWRSEAWRPAAEARNRSPGRSGTPSARHYDLAARSSLHGSGGNAGDGSTGPRPKIATVERREARVPPLRGARRLARAMIPYLTDRKFHARLPPVDRESHHGSDDPVD